MANRFTNLRLLWLERSGSKTDVSVKVEEVALKLLRRGDCMSDCPIESMTTNPVSANGFTWLDGRDESCSTA